MAASIRGMCTATVPAKVDGRQRFGQHERWRADCSQEPGVINGADLVGSVSW